MKNVLTNTNKLMVISSELLTKFFKFATGINKLEIDLANTQRINKSMRGQIQLQFKKINEVSAENTKLKVDLNEVKSKYSALLDRHERTEGLWEGANLKSDATELEMERILTSGAAMSEKIFNGFSDSMFSVLTARKTSMKPFDYATWEVVYIQNNALVVTEIKRYTHETLLDVMRLMVNVQSKQDILNQSIATAKEVVYQ